MKINLHIDTLLIDGLEIGPGDGARVKAAVESGLSRLLQQGGIAPGLREGGTVSGIRTAPLQADGKSSPKELGTQIAQAVYGGIGK